MRVTDGDTVVVLEANNVQHKIRLRGFDAHERGQAYGTKLKEHLSDAVAVSSWSLIMKSVIVTIGYSARFC